MEFAITFRGDLDKNRVLAICRQAEAAGFDYAWFFDSHVLWRDLYPQMAVAIEHTRKLRFGPCVTNPAIRDWSVAASLFAAMAVQSDGRFDMGVGRGDSSVRVIGKRPATVARLEEFCIAMKALVRGEQVAYEDAPEPVRFDWTGGYEMPVWVAAYGPRALAAAGRVGDGLIVQLADVGLCQWMGDQARAAGSAQGHDMAGYRVMACAPVWVGDRESGIAQTKWFRRWWATMWPTSSSTTAPAPTWCRRASPHTSRGATASAPTRATTTASTPPWSRTTAPTSRPRSPRISA